MSIKKDYLSIQLKKGKLKIGIILLVLLGVAVLLRLTPLVHKYWINLFTSFVVSNSFCIIIISFLLIALHFVDLQRYKEILAKEDLDNVD